MTRIPASALDAASVDQSKQSTALLQRLLRTKLRITIATVPKHTGKPEARVRARWRRLKQSKAFEA